MTFNFQDVPVRTVLQLIAEESNLNIVAADTVQGNVTLRLINVPWDQALAIIGTVLGKRIADRVPAAKLTTGFVVLLIALAAYTAVSSISQLL